MAYVKQWLLTVKNTDFYKPIVDDYNWSEGETTRKVKIAIEDDTRLRITITRDKYEELEWELNGQIYDGFFEDQKIFRVEEAMTPGDKESSLINSGFNSSLVHKLTGEELEEASTLEDWPDLEEYMDSLARKYHI